MIRLVLTSLILALIATFSWAHWPETQLSPGVKADLVVVEKANRTMHLIDGGSVLKSYRISLGRQPVGPKRQEGDGKTPEGKYVLDYRKPDSSFHRALHVSYPSAADTASANSGGVDPGGLIMIHGLRNGLGALGRLHRLTDWTDGCIAVTNREIEEIWNVVPDGTPIVIKP